MRGIVCGLLGDADEQGAGALGLDYANGLTVDDQEVIAATAFQRHLAQRDAAFDARVVGRVVLYRPAGRDEHRIDLLAGKLFRARHSPAF